VDGYTGVEEGTAMSDVDGLLASALDGPDDQARWLVLADWLEEQGDPDNLARAKLLRLQVERARWEEPGLEEEDFRALAILEQSPRLVGAMAPLLNPSFPVLSVVPGMAMFLLADLVTPAGALVGAGSKWEGELVQTPFAFATTLWLRKRRGNQLEGDMVEDFRSIHGRGATGTFYFRGVVVGQSHVAFVTYRTKRFGVQPGLYEFHLGQFGRLDGTWWVPGHAMRGEMWLQRKKA
jgi:uncharacterized protein (TIGR02996 family)